MNLKTHIFKAYYLFYIALFFIVNSCKTTSDPAPVANKYLVSSSLIGTYTKASLSSRTDVISGGNTFLAGIVAGLLKYDIKAYKIVYTTKNTDGTDIQASGALIIPNTADAIAMISQQHGTIRNDNSAPSNYQNASEAYTIASIFGSNGYIIACPDYIGYGTSKSLPHPYEHRESLAQTSLDMIRASAEFVNQNSINWNKKLMITGYSQGGFATMSLQKKIEEEFPKEFNLVASSCGAGAYNKTEFMKRLINTKSLGVAQYNQLYIWVTQTYNTVYKLNRPMNTFFKEPYLTDIQTNGINANVNVSLDIAFNDTFKKGIMDGTDTPFLNAVKDNDIFDWAPKTETQLYHGNADPLVGYFNSETALKAMKAKGGNVTLTTIDGGTHDSSIQQYLLGTYSLFDSKK